ncbi:MAG: hypothetical protein V4726_22285 [Verrucomicrobiota bacterium]
MAERGKEIILGGGGIFSRFAVFALIPQNPDQSDSLPGRIMHGYHAPAGPEPASIPAKIPALIQGRILPWSRFQFLFGNVRRTVLRSENDISGAAQNFVFRKTENAFRANIPTGDFTFRIGAKNSIIRDIPDYHPQMLPGICKISRRPPDFREINESQNHSPAGAVQR